MVSHSLNHLLVFMSSVFLQASDEQLNTFFGSEDVLNTAARIVIVYHWGRDPSSRIVVNYPGVVETSTEMKGRWSEPIKGNEVEPKQCHIAVQAARNLIYSFPDVPYKASASSEPQYYIISVQARNRIDQIEFEGIDSSDEALVAHVKEVITALSSVQDNLARRPGMQFESFANAFPVPPPVRDGNLYSVHSRDVIPTAIKSEETWLHTRVTIEVKKGREKRLYRSDEKALTIYSFAGDNSKPMVLKVIKAKSGSTLRATEAGVGLMNEVWKNRDITLEGAKTRFVLTAEHGKRTTSLAVRGVLEKDSNLVEAGRKFVVEMNSLLADAPELQFDINNVLGGN